MLIDGAVVTGVTEDWKKRELVIKIKLRMSEDVTANKQMLSDWAESEHPVDIELTPRQISMSL